MDEVNEKLLQALQEQTKVLTYLATDGDPDKIREAEKSVATAITAHCSGVVEFSQPQDLNQMSSPHT
ncbi:MAG: hypothetical protein ACXABF_16125 [Candidatus Thorarchaeota archaeon]|jgi:hypothetical protein